MMKSSVTIAGILVSVLLGISHFETVNLSLWNRAEIHVLGDGAGEHLWSVVASSGTADGVLTGTLFPCLGAGKVEPTHRLTKELTHTLVEDVVDGYGCRCGIGQFLAIVSHLLTVAVVVPTPLSCTGTENVHEFAGTVTALRGSALNGCLGCNEVKF